jgi:uncharacterized protein involved in type VI secretion and phage assembly
MGEEARRSKVAGVVLGVVTNNKDPEKIGRVKLRLPWHNQDEESDWIRIVSLMAGKEMGIFFLPDKGDQVVVAFDNGDIGYPYVIGALWDSQNKPPETNSDGKNNIKLIKSRSGHKIIIDDNAEGKKEMMVIQTKSGHKIALDDSQGKEMIEIRDKSGESFIRIDSAKNEIAISSAGKLSIKDSKGNSIQIDSGKIAVSSQNELAISSQAKLSLKAQIIEIEAGATMTIKSSGPLTVQGAIVKIN